MAQTRAAIRYAKAVLDLAKDQKTAEVVNTDMKLIVEAVAVSKDLKDMLLSGAVPSSVKKSALFYSIYSMFPAYCLILLYFLKS